MLVQIAEILETNDQVPVTQLSVKILYDDLNTHAVFYWALHTVTGTKVNEGTVDCVGEEYELWDGNNNFPYEYVAQVKGLSLI
jgi:hypothetical protein